MTSKLRSFLAEFTLPRIVAGLVFLPLLAFAFQPFQSTSLSFPLRFVFWFGVMALAVSATWAARKMVQRWGAGMTFSAREFAVVPVVFVLFVPTLWLLAWLVLGVAGQPGPDYVSAVSYGALFAAGLVLVRRDPARLKSQQPDAQPRLLKRLPDTFRGEILRLTVRDHAVDVVTSEGTMTIRSRFCDAVAEMEPVQGHFTHRSHWVAECAITGVERQGGKTALRLSNGDLVPVSRTYKPMLEQDGVV